MPLVSSVTPLPNTPPGVAATCDQIFATLAARLAPIQAGYFAAHGHYWQGLSPRSPPPADGVAVIQDGALRPTGQVEDWDAVGFTLTSPLPLAVGVDVYDGPRGKGYILRTDIILNGVRWERCANVGPETWRTKGWVVMNPTGV